MLEEKNVELLVYQCLAQIDERLNKHIITYYDTKQDEVLDDEIDKHLDKYKEKFMIWQLHYRTEIIIAVAAFVLGAVIF